MRELPSFHDDMMELAARRHGPAISRRAFGMGLAAAAACVSPDLKRFNPTDAANLKVQIVYGGDWWGKDHADANRRHLDSIAG